MTKLPEPRKVCSTGLACTVSLCCCVLIHANSQEPHDLQTVDECDTFQIGPAAAPARWRCGLQGMSSTAAADAARGGRRVRWRSYNNKTTSGRSRTTAYGGQAARRTFAYFGWEETGGDDWDLLWTGRGQYDFLRQAGLRNEPAIGRRHNHCFPSGLLAGNKKSLVKRHNAMVDLFGSHDFAHLPETFELPYQRDELIERMDEEQSKYDAQRRVRARVGSDATDPADVSDRPLWILKPTLGARGEGIELLWNTKQVHLRLYVAITSLEPLRVLLFRDGLVLFANAKYNLSENALVSKQVHLTNAAIARPANQKGRKILSPRQDQLEAIYDNEGDNARSWLTWSLRPFLEHLVREGVDVMATWARVESALVKTVLTAQALQRLPKRHPGSCIDLFGFDVMFDTDLQCDHPCARCLLCQQLILKRDRPYVLEVNLAPALNSHEPGVNQVVHDRVLLHLIGLLSRNHQPTREDMANMRARLNFFAPRHNFSFCDDDVDASKKKAADLRVRTALAYKDPIECIDDHAVAEIWRLTKETEALGLWQRLYPHRDASTGDRFGRFWMHNGQTQGTVGRRGPSFLQRLTAAWAEYELKDADREFTVEDWVSALNEQEPQIPARDPDGN